MKSILVLISTLISIAAFADTPPTTPSCPVIRTAKLKYTLTKTTWVQDGTNWVQKPDEVCTGDNDIYAYQEPTGICHIEPKQPSTPAKCVVQVGNTFRNIFIDGMIVQEKDKSDRFVKFYNIVVSGDNSFTNSPSEIPFLETNAATHDLGLKDISFYLTGLLNPTSPEGLHSSESIEVDVTIEDLSAK